MRDEINLIRKILEKYLYIKFPYIKFNYGGTFEISHRHDHIRIRARSRQHRIVLIVGKVNCLIRLAWRANNGGRPASVYMTMPDC